MLHENHQILIIKSQIIIIIKSQIIIIIIIIIITIIKIKIHNKYQTTPHLQPTPQINKNLAYPFKCPTNTITTVLLKNHKFHSAVIFESKVKI